VEYIDTGSALMPNTPDSGKDPVVAMVSINLPLWYEKYRAAEREAKARVLSASKERKDKENTLIADLKMVLYRFRDGERKIDLYRDTLIPKAEQSLNAIQQSFVAGKAPFLDLIDAERTLLHFQLSYERALAERAQRLAEMEMLIGMEIPRIGPNDTENAKKGNEANEKENNQQ
jgi:outer membrane protein TolC